MADAQDEHREFVIYPIGGGAQKDLFRPSARLRQWQLDSHKQNAVRCLPLNIANCNGWEGIISGSFDAVWNGGSAVHDIEVIPHGDGPVFVASHFGEGVLTFIPGVLFRTPPGHNMMMMGPINQPKDGIHPLTGLIETDWAPYSITMNWKFTRLGRVSFKKGEPFCHVFPIERGYVESFRPVTRNAREHNPELLQEYEDWSKSRNHFNRELAAGNPDVEKQGWQKHYYRGLHPDCVHHEDAHQTKITLPEFEDLSGFDYEANNKGRDIRHPISACLAPLNEADSIQHYLDHVSPRVAEVLICDQGSLDGTREIIEACSYPNVRLVAMPEDGRTPLQTLAHAAQQAIMLILQPEDRLSPAFWQTVPHFLDQIEQGADAISHRVNISVWDKTPFLAEIEYIRSINDARFIDTGLERTSLCRTAAVRDKMDLDAHRGHLSDLVTTPCDEMIYSVFGPNHKYRNLEYSARKMLVEARDGPDLDADVFATLTAAMSKAEIEDLRASVAASDHPLAHDLWWGEQNQL